MEKILVKNSGIIKLQTFDDAKDGKLFIGEGLKNVPFDIKRFYYINDLSSKTAVRGKHAHKKLEQYIFCISGSFMLDLDDGSTKQQISLTNDGTGVKLGAMLWHTMSGFSDDCVILVVADGYYDESDYIRNYEDFIQQSKRARS